MKKVLSILLVAMLIIGMFPATVSAEPVAVATFELGNDGTASHADGSKINQYTESESDGVYTLTLSNLNNVYSPARDAKGNGCIKLGASSKAGGFSFTAPADVTKVVIAIGKYKANTTKVSVNGTTTTLTKNSNDGAYDEITVDTTSKKEISLTTLSGGYRAMVNTITFYAEPAADACKHENQTTTTVPATCTEAGSTTVTCDDCGEEIKSEEIPAGHTWDEGSVTTEPGCETEGERTYTCTVCGETKEETVSATGHSYVDGVCSVCGAEEPNEVVFELGENGAATHKDGSTGKTTDSYTVGDYTLELTSGVKMFPGSYDAKGNSCIKLGTGSEVGGFSFTVPDDVVEVRIYVAGYKANNATVTVNGEGHTIETHSNDGEYTEITVDTADVKTVTVATETTPDERAMVNTIVFCFEEAEESDCQHTNTTTTTVEATCTEAGSVTVTCDDCKETVSTETIAATGHTWGEGSVTAEPGCATEGKCTYTCTVCGGTKEESVPAKGHSYENGKCTVCGAEEPNEVIFQLGEDGEAKHSDGNSDTTEYTETVGGYKLKITAGEKMYPAARDEMGNGCIKLGTSKVTGGFSFTVPEDIGSVVIYIGKYKDDDSKVTINGKEYTLTKNSNDGEYDAITVDTNTTKQITLTTVSGGYRAMVNAIKFCVGVDVNMPVIAAGDQGYETLELALTSGETTVKHAEGGALPLDVTVGGTRYIALKADADSFYTYYKLKMGLSKISLRSSAAGIYYSATVIAPELLEALAAEGDVSYGVMLSLDGKPADLEEGKHTAIAGVPENDTIFNSGSVFGIFKEDLEGAENQKRAGMEIYARAYIKVGERLILSEKDVDWSFVEVLEEVNNMVSELQAAGETEKLTALGDFYKKWNAVGAFSSEWDLSNMAGL